MTMEVEARKADEKPADANIPDSVFGYMNGEDIAQVGQFRQPEELQPAVQSIESTVDDGAPQQGGADRVPIPPAVSPSHLYPSGPMSTSVTIPPRPKPGRKPIPQEDAADRRRLQNRIAQRNFRDKRQQKLAETQVELEEKKREYQRGVNEQQRHIDRLSKENAKLRDSNERLRKRAEEAEYSHRAVAERVREYENAGMKGNRAPLSPTGGVFTFPGAPHRKQPRTIGPSYRDPAALTPPEDTGLAEVDFTNYGRARQQTTQTLRPSLSNDSNMGFGMDISTNDDPCGFCTDSQNCLCKQQEDNAEPAPQHGPGNCNACLHDPNRAAACRQIASSARPHHSEVRSTISCEEFMNRAAQSGERLASIPKLFGDRVRAFPAANGRYEIEEHQAAQALQTLSRRDTAISQQGRNESQTGPPSAGGKSSW